MLELSFAFIGLVRLFGYKKMINIFIIIRWKKVNDYVCLLCELFLKVRC